MTELQDNMPPGWDCKLDSVTGKHYYINHFTKTTTWEDPRTRGRSFCGTPKHFSNVNVEHIPLQHGSPDLKRNYVYPSQTSPIPAFQMPAHSPKNYPLQDLKNISRMSPLSVRSTSKIQESLLSITDSEESVAKISAMFPTVSENHIKLLLKKYHNREALVISALQVDKYPITTPGPFATPPPQRNIQHPNVHALQMTPPLGGLHHMNSRGGSPILRPSGSGSNSVYTGSPQIGETFRNSPRPHSSPKLKLRYMKSIFPQAEEMLILEILSNNDSNIQKSSEILKDMGFLRKDAVRAAQQKIEIKKEQKIIEETKKNPPPKPTPKLKTLEEKEALKMKLKEKYKTVADHLITIALESVDFSEKRANQILEIMMQEDNEKNSQNCSKEDEVERQKNNEPPLESSTMPISQSRQSLKSILKSEKPEKELTTFSRVIDKSSEDFKSLNLINTNGANPSLAKGANDKNLLEEYVKWQGPRKSLRKGSQPSLAKGANASLLSNRYCQPCGANVELRKGPKFGLAKGSIFTQLKSVIIGDSHGK